MNEYDWKTPHIKKHWAAIREKLYIHNNGFIYPPQAPSLFINVSNDPDKDFKVFEQKRAKVLKQYAIDHAKYLEKVDAFSKFMESKSDKRADTASKTVGA